MATTSEDRPLRVCDLCGGVDDHPRHVIAGSTSGIFTRPSDEIINRVLTTAPEEDRARLLGDLTDTGSSDRHLDCCRDAGCPETDPEKNCNVQLADVEDLHGVELAEWLYNKGLAAQKGD